MAGVSFILTLSALFLTIAQCQMLLGGQTPVPVTDPSVEAAAKFAVSQLSHKNGFPLRGNLHVEKVISAKKQVVAGTNYFVTLLVSDGSQHHVTTDVEVFEPLPHAGGNSEPWTLKKFSVHPDVDKSQYSDEENAAASHAVKLLNERSNSLFPYELKKILSVKQSEEDPTHFTLKLELSRGSALETMELKVAKQNDNHWVLQS